MLRHKLGAYVLGVVTACIVTGAAPSFAQTPSSWVQAGQLTCKLNPSIGFVIFGHQSMECNFLPVSGPLQAYQGAINTVGIDLGVTGPGGLAWTVFGSAAGLPAGALAGEYVGVSGDVGLGVGVGANVLVGGSNRSVALQPVSLEGSVAINVVAGLSQLKLRAVPY